ncbi:MAG: anthranilate synthase component [Clostridia bacterium]|jgi:anthranilate synthase component 1|nr:anthranilate synthase component [Clostridia bacterium]
MYYPSLEQYQEWSVSSKVIPVSYEMNADTETPISLFKKFSTDQHCYLFESVEGGERWARYSFMGRKPLSIFKTVNGNTSIQMYNEEKRVNKNPIKILKELLEQLKSRTFSHLPRFYGGVVGYFSYDFVRYYENIKDKNMDEIGLPDCHLIIPEEVVVFDHLKQKIYIIVNTIPQYRQNVYNVYNEAIKKIDNIISELSVEATSSRKLKNDIAKANIEFSCSVSKEQFCSNVKKAKQYIKDGDIFQVVLSQRLKSRYDGDPFDVYRILRTLNPSPYMYFLKFDDYSIAGASPEMLVRVEQGVVETCPIAGTRPRGKSAEEDEVLADELLKDEKEIAEHIMLVDLGRNDVGRVCEFGSVKAENLMHIEKYSHVMHMVTNVQGILRKDKSPVDVLTGLLPAGTVSGAPKVRAMEIIEEIENLKRGVYAGAIGYIGFDGNLDTCIAIRTAIFRQGYVYVQAGAGIVADSIPEKEYEETLNKAQALISAVKKAGGAV